VVHRDDAHRFSISLPAFWLPAPQFLASSEFGRFARRHPLIAREYRTLVRHARSRFPLLAFDASAKAFRDAAVVDGMGETQIQGKPPGRPWLIVGLAFAHTTHYVDAARDEPNRTYQAAWPTTRYL